jgi:GNAT superfamily N-acetyltransferase
LLAGGFRIRSCWRRRKADGTWTAHPIYGYRQRHAHALASSLEGDLSLTGPRTAPDRDNHGEADIAATAADASASKPIGGPPLTLGRLAAIWRSEGPKGLWFRALAWVGYRRWDCFARPLAPSEVFREPGVPIEIAALEPDDAAEYVSLRPEATLTDYRERLRAGQVCWAARRAGRLIAVKWVRFDAIEVPYLERPFPLAPGEIYLHDMFTSPDMRGQHVQSAISARIFARYRAQGYSRSVGLVSPANRSSLASLIRTGYRRTGWVSLFHLGPLRRERMIAANGSLRKIG